MSGLHKAEILCSLCGASIPNFVPEYFCGEKYNPACQACKACDSLWSPDDPFSSFPSPSPPVSLVSHWLLPRIQQEPQNPSSIVSLVSHCSKFPNPDLDIVSSTTNTEEKLIDREDFKQWMVEFREQLRTDRTKMFEELRKDFSLLKEI